MLSSVVARLPFPRRRVRPGRTLRVGVPAALAALLALYLIALVPWMERWGTTAAEWTASLPGDELAPSPTHQSTRAITVRAPAAETWRWLVQIGEDRAGFYSYDWLENLFGARIRNANVVHPAWQTLREGDLVRAVPNGYLGGVLDDTPGWRVASIEPGRWFVLRGWGVFLVRPVDAATSRVIVRTRFRDETWWGPVITALAFEPVHFVMERRMLVGIRDRAEGRRPNHVIHTVASAGFAAGVIGVVLIALRRRRPVLWVAPSAALAIAVVASTNDARAAAAGFVALGAVVLALPALRRRWPVLVPVAVGVLLVLLFATDAFVVLGLALLAAMSVPTAVWQGAIHDTVRTAVL